MGYTTVRETTYPSWEPYAGSYEILIGQFNGPPEQVLPVSIAAWIVQEYEELFGTSGETLMYLKVEADWSPTFWTNYRITAKSHGSPFPQALLVAIVAALIIIGLVLLTWQLSEAWKSAGEAAPGIGLGIFLAAAGVAGGIALVLLALSSYNKSRALKKV